jgi:hypothetical protein
MVKFVKLKDRYDDHVYFNPNQINFIRRDNLLNITFMTFDDRVIEFSETPEVIIEKIKCETNKLYGVING